MSVTLILVICIAGASILAWQKDDLMRKWIFNPYLTAHKKQYYRFITSGFIHKDTIHLLFNLFVLYMFGEYVEREFVYLFGSGPGKVLLAVLFLGGVIISDIPTYFKYKDAPHYNALGASGGVSSVLFSFVFFYPLEGLCLYGLQFLCFPGILWAAAYIGYSIYASKKGIGNINHDAHLYGALFGIVFTIVMYPPVFSSFIDQMKNFSL